jgi:hypothetical protein
LIRCSNFALISGSIAHGSVDEFFLSGKQISFGWAVMDQISAAMDRHLDVIQCHTGLSKMLLKLSHNDKTDSNKTRHLTVLSFFINLWFSTNKESFKCQFIFLSYTIQLLCFGISTHVVITHKMKFQNNKYNDRQQRVVNINI